MAAGISQDSFESLLDDHFHDQCGVVGVFGDPEAATKTYLGLHALQHRGQESAGIATADAGKLLIHRELGLVQDVFNPATLAKLTGNRAIGHVRYSTAGGSHIRNVQPIGVDYAHGSLAVAHNGNLTNAEELRSQLEAEGSIFQSTSDTEVFVHLIARSRVVSTVERMLDTLHQVRGAYSLLVLTPKKLIAVRDPQGFRPLCLGKLPHGYAVASEPPAFDLMGATYVRDIEPGEMVVIDDSGMTSMQAMPKTQPRMCIFEYVYFARPDATLGGINVYEARKRLGARLAEEQPADADVVIPVPDSGVAAALGFAERMKLPFEMGLLRSHYMGRTFIEPEQSIRNFGVRLKLSPVRHVLKGKRVAVIDDSIVRGTTSRKIVQMLRDAGAKEVHLRISSPPTIWPCFYGIDTPTREELIAANHSTEAIRDYVTCDSLGYLSLEGLHASVGNSKPGAPGFCDACFSGNYPVALPEPRAVTAKRQLSLL